MNKLFFLLVPILIFNKAHCQPDSLVVGAYKNLVEFKNQNPSFQSDFIFTKKYNKRIPELYTVNSVNSVCRKGIRKNEIWCIYDGKYFYLNSKRIGMPIGFIRFEKTDKYLCFQGKPVKSLAQEEKMNRATLYFGLTGLAVSNALINAKNNKNNQFILNLESGMINYLTPRYVEMILEPYPELRLRFQHEKKDSVKTLHNYLDLLNQQIKNK
jgi:hypothetical protein